MKLAKLSGLAVAVSALALSGCSTPNGYEKAFATSNALSGNTRSYAASSDEVFRAVKVTLVQRGFTIEQADLQSGVIRALRSLEDPKDPKLAYLITATIDISGAPGGGATVVTASANEQTVLHKDSNKYYHFLGLVPIPTGKDYQTVVRKEGTIGNPQLYRDFFDAVAKNLKNPTPDAQAAHETRLAVAPQSGSAPAPGAATGSAARPVAAEMPVAAAVPIAAAPSPPTPSPTSPPAAIAAGAPDLTAKPSAAAATGAQAADEQATSLQSMANPFAAPAPADKPQ